MSACVLFCDNKIERILVFELQVVSLLVYSLHLFVPVDRSLDLGLMSHVMMDFDRSRDINWGDDRGMLAGESWTNKSFFWLTSNQGELVIMFCIR